MKLYDHEHENVTIPPTADSKSETIRHQFLHLLTKRVCFCVWDNTPSPDNHIEEEGEQVIHAPQEIPFQHRFYFLGQLLKCFLDDQEFVWRSEGGAACAEW